MNITTKGEKHFTASELSTADMKVLAQLPGFFKWDGRDCIIRASGANITFLQSSELHITYSDTARAIVNDYMKQQQDADAVRAVKSGETKIADDDFTYYREPMKHQKEAFLLSRDKEYFALLCEQGTGKTKIIIDTASYLYQQGKIDALIIIAYPNGVHRNWIDTELPQDWPPSVKYVADFWRANVTKKFQTKIDRLKASSAFKIFAFNADGFTSKKASDLCLDLVKNNRCLVVIDQSASIKNITSNRTKFILNKIKPHADYRRILDGAPVAEGGEELYAQYKFLSDYIIGHDTFTAFKSEFCKIGRFNEIAGYRNIDELHRRIDGYSYRVLTEDCMDLPERQYHQWKFQLNAKEQKAYYSVVKGAIDDPDAIIIESALLRVLRLQQINSGWISAARGEEDFQLSTDALADNQPSRMQAFKKLIGHIDGKALIFSKFVADIQLIVQELGDSAVAYYGDVASDDRAEAKLRFMNDDSVKYLVGQPLTAGIGHTFTSAKHVIFYTNSYSLRYREECEKRAHRKGIETTLAKGESLMIWDLMATTEAEHTIDHRILKVLRAKKDVSDSILKDPASIFLMENIDA